MSDLRQEMQAIYDAHGFLDPETVVNVARARTHPLHSRFEWDNRVAGEAYRREQARRLIGSIEITYREATETEEARRVRAFHAVRGSNGYRYEPVDKVVADPLTTKMLLRDMERDWLALRRRYEHLAEFIDLVRKDIEQAA